MAKKQFKLPKPSDDIEFDIVQMEPRLAQLVVDYLAQLNTDEDTTEPVKFDPDNKAFYGDAAQYPPGNVARAFISMRWEMQEGSKLTDAVAKEFAKAAEHIALIRGGEEAKEAKYRARQDAIILSVMLLRSALKLKV